ncbi:MAG: hypothetical protein WA919_02125 [Coleofasciculaceae cyanobacterium]
MAEVTPVSEAQASSFQQNYQQIIEEWLKQFLDTLDQQKEQGKPRHKQKETKPAIHITDGDKVVYDQQAKGELVNDLNPELMSQLGAMKNTPVGEKVPNAANKTVAVNDQVVLQSDSKGKIIANSFKEQYKEATTRESKTGKEELLPTPPQNTSGGLEIVQQFLQKNLAERNDSLAQFLRESVQEMRTLQQQATQEQKQLLTDLLKHRVEQPKQVNWWQQMTGKAGQTFSALKEQLQQRQAASTLRTLFHSEVEPLGHTYHATDYTISRQGRSYTLSDTQGKQLMQFRSTALGVKLEGDVQLQPEQYQEIRRVREQLSQGQQPQGSFQPLGMQEAQYFNRVHKIAQALTQYAASTGQKQVEVEGKFAYRWLATADGQVRIDAKDGRGSLLVKDGGHFCSQMSTRDLAHFEKTISVLQRQSTLGKTVTKSEQKGKESLSL